MEGLHTMPTDVQFLTCKYTLQFNTVKGLSGVHTDTYQACWVAIWD